MRTRIKLAGIVGGNGTPQLTITPFVLDDLGKDEELDSLEVTDGEAEVSARKVVLRLEVPEGTVVTIRGKPVAAECFDIEFSTQLVQDLILASEFCQRNDRPAFMKASKVR